ncbi:MAG TPA: hypothetical protein VFX60_04920 [Micromonospora sp.]|nr:hypothetical protein [Micromonospora sp.]
MQIWNRFVDALYRWRWDRSRPSYPDRWTWLHTELIQHRRRNRPHWWSAPTVAFDQIGRTGRLTPAQAWRANGGRWPHQRTGGDRPAHERANGARR